MIVQDVCSILETWAPKELARERDNVGIQIGSLKQKVKKILIALDVTDKVVAEAQRKKADLIISHHPLFLNSPTSAIKESKKGAVILTLARENISVYSMHTNLDCTSAGVSITLAEKVKLKNISALAHQRNLLKKIVVYVPRNYVDKVLKAMGDAGAGKIGNYDYCSFQISGKGTFQGSADTKPFLGKAGRLETVEEIRLEMVVHEWNINKVITAMHLAHPYEEVAYDIYEMENETPYYGNGAIGEFEKEMEFFSFLRHLKKTLQAKVIRYSDKPPKKIKRVAVCGGSGSDLLPVAMSKKADAFVTADVKYHLFQLAEKNTALIDVGHFETEYPILKKISLYLNQQITTQKELVNIYISKQQNPVRYY